MKLHVLTAVTRPEHLPTIEASLALAAGAGVDVVWHQRFDPEHRHVGGQALKNDLLDGIGDGWVWICDDDNVAHPEFFSTIRRAAAEYPDAALLICAQALDGGHIRRVHRQMLRETHVDAAQVVARREAIGDIRIPLHYCGDGAWIERLAAANEGRAVFLNMPIVYYNRLRWRAQR